LLNRRFLGIDIEEEYLKISKCRKHEIENESKFNQYRNKLHCYKQSEELRKHLLKEPTVEYHVELDFNNNK